MNLDVVVRVSVMQYVYHFYLSEETNAFRIAIFDFRWSEPNLFLKKNQLFVLLKCNAVKTELLIQVEFAGCAACDVNDERHSSDERGAESCDS